MNSINWFLATRKYTANIVTRKLKRALRYLFGGLVVMGLLANVGVVWAAEETEKVLPAGLTPEQRTNLILEPEFADAFYGQVDRLYLSGYWKFKPEINLLERRNNKAVSIDPKVTKAPATDPGLEQGYFKPEFNVSGWDEIPVPWPWNVAVPSTAQKKTTRIAFAGLGYYRTTFQVPKEKKGKRVFIHFDSVQTECMVWLNGTQVGTHTNYSSDAGQYWTFNRRLLVEEFELDVTDAVKFGVENTLVLRVFDDGLPIVDGNPNDGGIMGPVTVDFRETVDFSEILVDADPDGTVTIQARAVNSGAEAVKLPVVAQVEPFKSKSYTPPAEAKAATAKLGEVSFPKGESEHKFSFKVANPVLWDVNRPSLYRLRLVDGPRILGQTRIGFRRMEVRGQQFFLNGHPIYLRGVNQGNIEYWGSRMWAFNKADWYRQAMKLFTEVNLNMRRTNGGPMPRIGYDVCDELGLINEDDFTLEVRSLAMDDVNTTGNLIAEAKVDGMTTADGQLTPYGKMILRKWLVQLHNHPSVCFLTAGNEIGFHGKEKQLGDYMRAFYNYMKEVDVQKRLVTPSSGLTIWQWNTQLPADYFDSHDYENYDMGYLDCTSPMGAFAQKHWLRIYGKIDRPLLMGECGGYQSAMTLRSDIQALMKDGKLDKSAYVKWANGLVQKKGVGYWDFVPRMAFAGFNGIRCATSKEALSQATAKLYPEFIRRVRRDMDIFQGLVVHDFDASYWGLSINDPFVTAAGMRANADQARKNIEFLAERQAYAPLAALPDVHDRHRYAGEKFVLQMLLLNDQFATTEKNLVIEAVLQSADGKTVCADKVTVAEVPEYARIAKTLTLSVPAETATGDYLVRTRLLKGDTVVQENSTPVYVQSVAKSKEKVQTKGKVALYEKSGSDATKKVLDDLGVAYTAVEKLDGLDAFDTLIIGVNSVDMSLSLEMDKLNAWLEKGGRIVCLEQRRIGPVAFAPGLNFADAGEMLFADVIDETHPIQQDLRPGLWDVWNGDCVKANGGVSTSAKAIYSHFLVPMPEGVAISGGNRALYRFGKNPIFGMVSGEVKVGQGLVFFSQPLATARYGKDPVATQYLRNVMEYTLGGKWTGERASVVK